ncbi:MAG: hypothetical protein QOJ00_2084 [Actinomycetota bacterium]|jgi:hypothetical protein
MPRRTSVLFAVLAIGAVGAAVATCGDNSKPSDKVAATTTTVVAGGGPSSTSTAAGNQSTTGPGAYGTPSGAPSGPPSSPQGAADGLFNAWKKNDQADASNYAKPQAISKMFSHPYTTDSVTYSKQACQPQGGQFNCVWSYEGGAVKMTVEAWPGGGFVVDSVTYVAD